ncbi:Retrovirus-related Pol polyprotein from transposon 17.6 [Gossypium australe]|uniref:Retrovirus-related Pol polyprotein from transposon 17.6 n=1 Tax=Gossypium australe TaxID=47621 RepID=A0A5B6VN19_9ROSI|nr:Retrovirus-related Pol polyprotein from transposon 17.6 [Gossypium australe]
MPNYMKFMKDILLKKRRLGEFETVALTKWCIEMFRNKLAPTLNEPESFTIPCSIDNHYVSKSLCDLGASINLMPMSIFRKLGIGKCADTDEECNAIEIIDTVAQEKVEDFCSNNSKNDADVYELIDADMTANLDKLIKVQQIGNGTRSNFEPLNLSDHSFTPPQPSIDDPPKLELKPLPVHLKYACLGENNTLPVVNSTELTLEQEGQLLEVLRKSNQMLDRLAGKAFYCFLDGYSGYNQIAIAPTDQENTTFTCPYGTSEFQIMPFGLCNAPANFQHSMMAIFLDMVEKFLRVFMDDFSVFGYTFEDYL